MDRRQLLAGTVALLGDAQIKRAFAGQQSGASGENKIGTSGNPPKNLLTTAYPAGVLSQHLLSPSNWHPFPRWSERDAWQSVPEDVRGVVIQKAEASLGAPWESLPADVFLDFRRNGNRTRYERLYFTRQERITEFTVAECVEGKGRFLDEIANGVWLTCEESFWGLPAHLGAQKAGAGLPDITEPIIDLFAAETSATLSWVYYYLGDRLDQVSPLIRPRVVMEAKRRILDPALARNDFTWMGLDGKGRRLNNWTPWINSNWMATSLILEQDSARRAEAIGKICRSLDQYLAGYSPDGGCDEGPGYWNVSAASYFDCCDMLASATGGQVSVIGNPFIAKMVQYIADVHIADGDYVNYGDAHVKAGPSPELVYRLGSTVNDTVLEEFGAFNIPSSMTKSRFARPLSRAIPNMMIVGKARTSPKADALVRDAWYPDLCLMTARRKAGASDGFYLAVQAAPNLRSHGHNDSGSFIVFHNGEPVFIDVGVEAYTAKTFSADRYSIWTMQSAYHNLPIIGGVMQTGDKPRYRASEIHYDCSDDRTTLAMNLATAYPDSAGVNRWMRTVTLDRTSDKIRLQEKFQLKQKSPIALSFITPRTPSDDAHGTVTLTGVDSGTRGVVLSYDAKLLKPAIEPIPLEDEGLRENWGKQIYRVLLNSVSQTDKGEWEFQIS
jgi:hypothetical protein